MQIIRHPEHCPTEAQGAALALGNFDGVHLGHQAVIAQTLAIARAQNIPCGVLTFSPHPREYFNPGTGPLRLYPLSMKERILKSLGVDILYLLHFDETLAALPADAFIDELLVCQLGAKHLVTGEDFAFGRARGGNASLLAARAGECGFGYTRVPAVSLSDGEKCSSTAIRTHLAKGEVQAASRLLGRAYSITGRVQHGDARGRTLGFPTANIAITQLYNPASGVYVVKALLEDGRSIGGVANLGTRPTVGGVTPLLEVHCFDLDEDLYEKTLEVQLLDYLRPELKFDSLDTLKQHIAQDVANARTYLRNHP